MQSINNIDQLAFAAQNRGPLAPAGEALVASRWFGRDISICLDHSLFSVRHVIYSTLEIFFRMGGSSETSLSALAHYYLTPWLLAPAHRLVAEKWGKENYLVEVFNRADSAINSLLLPLGPVCYGMTFRFLQALIELQKKLDEPLSEEMIVSAAELFKGGADMKTCALQVAQSELGYRMVNHLYNGEELQPLQPENLSQLEGIFFLLLSITPPQGHASAMIKLSDELYYIFDPDLGLLKFTEPLCKKFLDTRFERESTHIQKILSFKRPVNSL